MPVVRRTGGLADTVKDVDAADAGETPNGFTFDGVDEASEDGALDRALAYFRRNDWWAEVRAASILHDHKTYVPPLACVEASCCRKLSIAASSGGPRCAPLQHSKRS